jgi:hypothetical protein
MLGQTENLRPKHSYSFINFISETELVSFKSEYSKYNTSHKFNYIFVHKRYTTINIPKIINDITIKEKIIIVCNLVSNADSHET